MLYVYLHSLAGPSTNSAFVRVHARQTIKKVSQRRSGFKGSTQRSCQKSLICHVMRGIDGSALPSMVTPHGLSSVPGGLARWYSVGHGHPRAVVASIICLIRGAVYSVVELQQIYSKYLLQKVFHLREHFEPLLPRSPSPHHLLP